MGQVIVIVVIVLLAVAFFAWARRKVATDQGGFLPAPSDPVAEAPSGPLSGLGVGAVVAHEGREYVVRGEIRFNEEGAVWTEYHLDTGRDERTWVSVDLSDGTDVAWWQGVPATGDLNPNRGSVTHEGRTYKKAHSGKAAFVALGATDLPPSGKVTYADFRAEGGRMLGFERWSSDGAWEVSTGASISPQALTVRPAGAGARGPA